MELAESGGNGLNMGLDRNFFSDGKGNHRISGIQSIPSKTGLIDSSSFVLEKRLSWAKIGGLECITRLSLNIFRARRRPWIQMFECLNFNFSARILIFQIFAPFPTTGPRGPSPCRVKKRPKHALQLAVTPGWHALQPCLNAKVTTLAFFWINS